MENLTEQEINLLFDALDAWLDRGAFGDVMGSLMAGVLLGDDTEAKAEWEEKQEDEKRTKEKQKRSEKIQVTLLKAKLINLQTTMEAAEIGSYDFRDVE